jgi:predicted Zn-dependent protease
MKTRLFLVAVWTAAIVTSTVADSDFSTQPRLPDDQRQTAQQAADEFKAGHFDAAAGLYQSIIKAYPDSLYAWSNLGATRFQQGHLDEAREAFKHALTLNPKDELVLVDLGIVYYQLNSFPDAIRFLKAAIAVNPNDASTHNFLGSTYEKAGMTQEAKLEHQKASELQAKEKAGEILLPATRD